MMPGPGPSLKSLAKDERPTASWPVAKRLLGYLTPHRATLAISIGWLVLSAATLAAQPALIGITIDRAVEAAAKQAGASTLTLPIGLLALTAILGWMSQRMQILLLGTVGQRSLYEVRKGVFASLQRLSVAFFDSSESGDLMSRLINDIEQVNSFLSQSFRRVISAGLSLIATLIGMFLVDGRLALVTLAVVPGMLGATRLFGLVARRAFRRRQESIGDVSSTLAEELAGIKIAQAFDRTDRNRDEFASRNAANRDANIAASAVSAAFSPTLNVLSTATTALVAVFGGWLAIGGLVTVGVVVAFFNYSRQFFNAVSQLSSLYAETQSALAGGERVFAIMDSEPDVQDSPDAFSLGPVRGAIGFDNVGFSYGGPDVLHDLNLRIEPGTSVAIVGPTGAGKTTLVSLVLRFYDPTRGRVTLDDVDLRDVRVHSIRSQFGIVLQDPFLFTGSIAENIRYGKLDATEDEIHAAAESTGALGFIEALPDGFQTRIGERGATLSTGQRQLLAFARAILADPAVLILDEATSSVDTRTELLLQTALRRLLQGRTALIIAHRLSTVRDVDRILVIEDGSIIEDGAFDELLARGGAFARLYAAQFAQ